MAEGDLASVAGSPVIPRLPAHEVNDASARAVGWIAVENWGSRLAGLALFLLLGRLLDPRDFGLVALATVFVLLVQVLVDQSFAKALVRHPVLTRAHVDTAFWTALGVAVLFIVGTWFAAPVLAGLADSPGLTLVLRVLSLSVLLGALESAPRSLLERQLDFRSLALRRLLATVAGAAVAVPAALLGAGVWSLVALTLVSDATAVVALWALSRFHPGLDVRRSCLRDLTGFGAAVLGIEMLGFVGTQVDKAVVGFALGPIALGLYAVASRLFQTVVDLVVSVVATAALPTFSNLLAAPDQLQQSYRGAVQKGTALAAPLLLGLAMTAEQVLLLALGAQWTPVAPVLQALCLAGLLYSATFVDKALLLAMGRSRAELSLTAAAALGNVAAVGLALVAGYGIVGVAVALTLRQYLLWPWRIRAVGRAAGVSVAQYLGAFTPPVAAAAVMAVVVVLIRFALPADTTAGVSLLFVVAPAVVVYLLTLRFLAPDAWAWVMAWIPRRAIT